MATLTKKLSDWFSPVKDALDEVHKTDAGIRAELSALAGERQTLLRSKPGKGVLIAGLPDAIAARGATWIRDHAALIVGALAGRVDVSPRGEVLGTMPGSLEPVAALPITFDMLCAVAPDQVKVALATAITTTSYIEGPSRDEVPRLLAEVNRKVADTEARHRELVDKAAEVGVSLVDLPENRAARIQAAREQERIDAFNTANARGIERGAVKRAETISEAR